MHDLNVIAEADWTRGWGLGLELWRRGERIFGGHTAACPAFSRSSPTLDRDRVGAIMLTNSSDWPKLGTTALELAEAALEELAPEPERWTPEVAPPPEIAPHARALVVGGQRDRSSAGAAASSRRGSPTWAPEREPAVFEREGDDRFRVVSGRERGETLRVVRDESGEVTRLYWATYPFTRTPEVFGPSA